MIGRARIRSQDFPRQRCARIRRAASPNRLSAARRRLPDTLTAHFLAPGTPHATLRARIRLDPASRKLHYIRTSGRPTTG